MDTLIGTIIASVIIGAVFGGLARILLPGRQRMGVFLTILAGAVAAFGGHMIAEYFDWHSGDVLDWPKLGVQLVLALIVVGLIGGVGRRDY